VVPSRFEPDLAVYNVRLWLPIGVVTTHEAIVNRLAWMRRDHPPGDIVLHKTLRTVWEPCVLPVAVGPGGSNGSTLAKVRVYAPAVRAGGHTA
jgi:hypothetical protein